MQKAVKKLIVIALISIPVAYVLMYFFSDERKVQAFDVGNDREVVIYAETSWEVSQPVMYEIIEDGEVVVPLTDFYYHMPSSPMPEFVMVRAGNLVGLAKKPSIGKLMVIHDFASGESWPHIEPTEHYTETRAKRERLLKAFNEAHPTGGYVASE